MHLFVGYISALWLWAPKYVPGSIAAILTAWFASFLPFSFNYIAWLTQNHETVLNTPLVRLKLTGFVVQMFTITSPAWFTSLFIAITLFASWYHYTVLKTRPAYNNETETNRICCFIVYNSSVYLLWFQFYCLHDAVWKYKPSHNR